MLGSTDDSKIPHLVADESYIAYEEMARDDKGATKLRLDTALLDKMMSTLTTAQSDLKAKENLQRLIAAMRVLSLILTNSKLEDANQDITKSASLSTILVSILRILVKKGNEPLVADVITELVKAIGLMGRTSFNKSVGIEPVFSRGFIPQIPILMHFAKDHGYPLILLFTLKATAIFLLHAGLTPLKLLPLYRELVDANIISDFCAIIKTISVSEITVVPPSESDSLLSRADPQLDNSPSVRRHLLIPLASKPPRSHLLIQRLLPSVRQSA